jgi:hypothetical protein
MATLTTTQITAVTLSPNPVSINAAFRAAVAVSEKTITLQPEPAYSGEYYSGEIAAQGG